MYVQEQLVVTLTLTFTLDIVIVHDSIKTNLLIG